MVGAKATAEPASRVEIASFIIVGLRADGAIGVKDEDEDEQLFFSCNSKQAWSVRSRADMVEHESLHGHDITDSPANFRISTCYVLILGLVAGNKEILTTGRTMITITTICVNE